MLKMNFNDVEKNLDKVCTAVVENSEATIIKLADGANVVMMSKLQYDNLVKKIKDAEMYSCNYK